MLVPSPAFSPAFPVPLLLCFCFEGGILSEAKDPSTAQISCAMSSFSTRNRFWWFSYAIRNSAARDAT